MIFIRLARFCAGFVLLLSVPCIVIFGLNSRVECYEFDEFYLFDVPYTNQGSTYWCGPASLSMVLNYWGYNVTMDLIASQIYDPQTNLTTIANMTAYPKALGFNTASTTGSIGYIQLYIQKGIPLIVLQKFSLQDSFGHYRVVVGYNTKNNTIITLDPAIGKDYTISFSDFVELWKPGSTFSTYNWTLAITPENEVLLNLMDDYQIYLNQGSHKLQLELDALKEKYNDLEMQNEVLIDQLSRTKNVMYILLGATVFIGIIAIYFAKKATNLDTSQDAPTLQIA